MPVAKKFRNSTKRGDTLIEVMVAMAILAVVTIVTVTMMNQGLNVAERSLELTTARNELNAQAEALRFIHSSYVSELNLPPCNDNPNNDTRCQAFAGIWGEITNLSLDWSAARKIQFPVIDCAEVYKDNKLANDNAFVVNTRLLQASNSTSGVSLSSIVTAAGNPSVFKMPDLNARILYDNPDTSLHELTNYTNLREAQGIWVVGVKSQETGAGGRSLYYDFHVETCWNVSGSNTPSSLDAVIRLYNPAARG